jgi:hypothetical protein
MVTLLPKQSPFEEIMHVSPFVSFEYALVDLVEFSTTSQEYDSEDLLHLCEDERSS